MRAAAYSGETPVYSIVDGPAHSDIGTWSDGTPIVALSIKHEAPIGP
jgi:hypothetical protein